MRVSTTYGITGSQGTFDFVDVDVDSDIPLFIDPAVIARLNSPWAAACTSSIQHYFQAVLDKIIAGDSIGAKQLLANLGEDNSTHLGYSSRSRGSGLGKGLAAKFYEELSTSDAVASGLISDIEDTALLIEGVREDRISDVTTNIIRRQLVEYTQATAEYYGIPLQSGVAIGPYWDNRAGAWRQENFDLPVTALGPLLLVPKSIVRRALFHNPSEYYRHYVLEYLRGQELARNSPLVVTLKSVPHVYKGDVERKYREKHGASREDPGVEKRINVEATQREPDLLRRFKKDKAAKPVGPPSHEELASNEPDLDLLLQAVVSLKGGDQDAHKYERAVEALLSALLYPHLVNPIRREEIHEGRKRIDISYTNMATDGFFFWLALHYPAANVVIECKNYTRPIGNPEYDQLAGRFSPSRGKYGLLVYREYEDKARVLASCRDTAREDRGFITAIDDDDLRALVQQSKLGDSAPIGGLLHRRFKSLINA